MTDHDMYAELAADILDLVSHVDTPVPGGLSVRVTSPAAISNVDEQAAELVREWVDENLSDMTLQMVEKMLLSDEFIREALRRATGG